MTISGFEACDTDREKGRMVRRGGRVGFVLRLGLKMLSLCCVDVEMVRSTRTRCPMVLQARILP